MRSIVLVLLTIFSINAHSIDLDKTLAKEYALYAMMASNAYLKEDRTYFPIEELGWTRVDLDDNLTSKNSYTPSWFGRIFSNLQYDIWVNEEENKTVISFKGTDEKIDWVNGNLAVGISIPYKSAKKHVRKYVKNNPNRDVFLTGHSLGGGLALSVSLWEGIGAYVFNSSPRVFDGIKNHSSPATRKVIYQEGDVLQKIRKSYPKFLKTIPAKDIVQTHFNYDGVSNHRADLLAEGILRCATDDPKLAELARKIPQKVECEL
jgi:hypothetical protein